ncbi:MAG: heavy-metal-associated domain-containing protein [Candidatus Thermoplasmatota archaeon]|nr:heavy-metal-associated domain-containing protein [Candidatus Thermoplasmatota archaeon]
MGLFGKKKVVSLGVEGLTCGHCVMAVTKALEKVEGVKKAKVNLDKKKAEVVLSDQNPASTDELISAVKEAGYEATLDG